MAATGFTPISLYYSATASAVPLAANLVAGELALNTNDGKLYYKNSSNVVTLLAGATSGPAGGSNTQVQFNSSGVLAGSANMTFDGTTLTAAGFAGPLNGTVGATTANTGAFTTLSATGVATFSAGTVSLPAITTTGDTNTGIFFPAADTIAFTEGGAESMRITSAGDVGIGTSSPSQKLTLASGFVQTGNGIGGAGGVWFPYGGDAGSRSWRARNDIVGYGDWGLEQSTTQTGTTFATKFLIDANGGVRINNTSNATFSAQLNTQFTTGFQCGMYLKVTDTSSSQSMMIFGNSSSDAVGSIATSGSATSYNTSSTSGVIGVDASTVAFNTASAERMRIDSSGNVGIGTTAPATKFMVSGFVSSGGQNYSARFSDAVNSTFSIGHQSGLTNLITDNAMTFYSSNTERMRIDTSGNVGIGMTPTNFGNGYTVLQVANATNGGMLYLTNTANAGGRIYGNSSGITYDAFSTTYHAFNNNGAERARISAAGGFSVGTTSDPGAGAIYATGNITAFFSDDRLKTKLGGIQDALAKVKTLSGFYYEPNQTAQDLGYEVIREVGVSAQQVQAVMPEVVVPAPIDDKYLTVRYEKLIPLLIEAIKELDAKIEGLVKA
jgi:hypothetical protein